MTGVKNFSNNELVENTYLKVSLIFFTLNEIDGMKAIMPRIKKEWYDQLIIVDGGSTDGTLEYARENDYFIFAQKEKGTAAAFKEAMEKVTGDIVIIFSPDGNSIPEKIPELIEKINAGYDVVICSRYFQDAKSYDDDVITKFGNWMFTSLNNLLFKTKYTDWLVMYRAYRNDIFQELNIDAPMDSWGTEILARATKKGMRITEIPGDEPARIGGVRKMQPLKNGMMELSMSFREFFSKRFYWKEYN
jgi:glycosyltransferase involved in cell wall biosynthesis